MQNIQNIEQKIKHAAQFVDRFRATASKAKQAQSRIKMIARMEEQKNEIEVDGADLELAINIPITTKSGIKVLHIEECAIGYSTPLIKNLSTFIERGQKIAIVGANGIGKSTLLKSIAKLIPVLSGRLEHGHNVKCAYYSQDQLQILDLEKSALENLLLVNPQMSTSQARNLLASFLLRRNNVFNQVKTLSGGEKSRLGLACLLAQDANLLLLDEPTNHLDMASTQILAESLSQYQGTVVFVSHNRNFINNCATQILAINSKGVAKLFKETLHDGDVDKFLGIESC
jgi:ATP-binding cassette subfamily F protein 3